MKYTLSLMLASVTCLGACSHAGRVQTTIPAAMTTLQSTLAQAGVISVSHAGDWTAGQAARFARGIRAAQCGQQAADPVVGTITGDVTLQLSGTFTQGGQFTVGALTTAPVFELGADASRTASQQVSLPVSYAPLSSMPDVEMARQMGYETALFSQNDTIRHSEASRLIQERESLRQVTTGLIRSWRESTCTRPMPVRPFVGGRGTTGHAPP
ncbi:hypothetical protein [Komagataeibacter sp. FNDCF1]|uniref:hypothetical protein n=1 Tax=Komagataeibacter sp. FNDCF1 TaxID=2878681 RepID=UPI001E382A8A|nr:hypothetical protein [Komagataeibacter sp. FNDCF1]MCE2565205.1 hypothetical protein [Komagataeibacter sp. FNDCF1]